MKPKLKWIALPLVLAAYAGLYIATSKEQCDDECQKFGRVYERLTKNRPYVINATPISQTDISVIVDPAAGINWNLFADTACSIVKGASLHNKNVVVINFSNSDTLAKKSCP